MADIASLSKNIFTSQESFEKHVLDVYNDADREDIMRILSERIIRILLKEEFNFLYMQSLENFRFSLIVNILFKEFSNEWVSYAEEKLYFSHEKAVAFLQEKSRLHFLLEIVKWYFRSYKVYLAEEIADTFIELVDSMPNATTHNALVERVLESSFVKKGSLSVVYNYNQLWTRIKSAHTHKNEQLSKLQIQIYEATELQEQERVKKLEYNSALLSQKSLAFFDDSVMRVRKTMVEYMLSITAFKE